MSRMPGPGTVGPAMSPHEKPRTAAITSRSAVVATLLLAGAVIVMALVLQGCSEADDGPIVAGSSAPGFTLTSLEGQQVSLSDYEGRPVLVNFWASWCPPCRDEFPELAKAREAHLDSGFEILGVTRNDAAEKSREFAEASGAEWPILPDPDDAAWEAFSPVGVPTSYFIDPDGVVQRVHIGPLSGEQLGDHLAAIGVPAEAGAGQEPA